MALSFCWLNIYQHQSFSSLYSGPTMYLSLALDWYKPHTIAAGPDVGIGKAFTKKDISKEEGHHIWHRS